MQYIHCCISQLTLSPYFSALTKRKVNGSNINISETLEFKELWGLLKILLLRNEYRHPLFISQKLKMIPSPNSEDICLQTLTSFSITWIKITRACGWQKSFRAGQILCAQTNFQHDFRQVSILEFPSAFDSAAFS